MKTKTANIQKTLTKDHTLREILVMAREALPPSEREDLDRNKPSFIYFDQPTVSDLLVVEYDFKKKVFKFRRCTDREWNDYYTNFLR